MEHPEVGLGYKIRKVLAYVRMYGLMRVLGKVRGQYHLRAKFDPLPETGTRVSTGKHVGLIGCGLFPFANICHYLVRNHGKVIRAGMDIDPHRAASLFHRYGLDYYTTDAQELFDDPEIDLIYVASNHASHAEYAIRALEAGKAVHIEKPHVVNRDQLARLREAAEKHGGKVHLGFNRPHGPIGQKMLSHLASQSGTVMINWFVAGHPIPRDHWYRNEGEGGRVLGNVCHWTDFTLHMIPKEGRYPIRINPTRTGDSDQDVAVTFSFGDGSIAALTFSAKGESFRGVRERFTGHRGDVLMFMDDFSRLTVDHGEKRFTVRSRHHDQGHQASILAAYEMSRRGGNKPGAPLSHVYETAELFLCTAEALETNQVVTIPDPNQGAASSDDGSEPTPTEVRVP
jgi:predicted dehydrogenase